MDGGRGGGGRGKAAKKKANRKKKAAAAAAAVAASHKKAQAAAKPAEAPQTQTKAKRKRVKAKSATPEPTKQTAETPPVVKPHVVSLTGKKKRKRRAVSDAEEKEAQSGTGVKHSGVVTLPVSPNTGTASPKRKIAHVGSSPSAGQSQQHKEVTTASPKQEIAASPRMAKKKKAKLAAVTSDHDTPVQSGLATGKADAVTQKVKGKAATASASTETATLSETKAKLVKASADVSVSPKEATQVTTENWKAEEDTESVKPAPSQVEVSVSPSAMASPKVVKMDTEVQNQEPPQTKAAVAEIHEELSPQVQQDKALASACLTVEEVSTGGKIANKQKAPANTAKAVPLAGTKTTSDAVLAKPNNDHALKKLPADSPAASASSCQDTLSLTSKTEPNTAEKMDISNSNAAALTESPGRKTCQKRKLHPPAKTIASLSEPPSKRLAVSSAAPAALSQEPPFMEKISSAPKVGSPSKSSEEATMVITPRQSLNRSVLPVAAEARDGNAQVQRKLKKEQPPAVVKEVAASLRKETPPSGVSKTSKSGDEVSAKPKAVGKPKSSETTNPRAQMTRTSSQDKVVLSSGGQPSTSVKIEAPTTTTKSTHEKKPKQKKARTNSASRSETRSLMPIKTENVAIIMDSHEYVKKMMRGVETHDSSSTIGNTQSQPEELPARPRNAWGASFGMAPPIKTPSSPPRLLSTTPLSSWFLSKGAANFVKQVHFSDDDKDSDDDSGYSNENTSSTPATALSFSQRGAIVASPRRSRAPKKNAFLESLAKQSSWRSWYGNVDLTNLLDPPLVNVPEHLRSHEVTPVQLPEMESVTEPRVPARKTDSLEKLEADIRCEKRQATAFAEQLLIMLQGKTVSGKMLEEEYSQLVHQK